MRNFMRAFFFLALLGTTALSGCLFSQSARTGSTIPHTNYGGCQIKGRHFHNTHVFIGDKYEPSLSEWLKY